MTRLIKCCPHQATKSAVSSNNPKSSSLVTFVLIIMIQHALHDQQKLHVTKVTSVIETVQLRIPHSFIKTSSVKNDVIGEIRIDMRKCFQILGRI